MVKTLFRIPYFDFVVKNTRPRIIGVILPAVGKCFSGFLKLPLVTALDIEPEPHERHDKDDDQDQIFQKRKSLLNALFF